MRILEASKQFAFTPRDGSLAPMGTDRPVGLHLSEIIKRRKVEAGESVEELPGDQPWIAAQLGFLWEMALDWAFKQFMGVERAWIEHQLHEQADEILGTPDGFDTRDEVLEEYKSTTRSMKGWEEDVGSFWTWMEQTMGYLYMVSKRLGRPITRVRFFVLWLYGDYSRKPGRGRQMTETLIEFDWEEIEQNWKIMLRYKDVIELELRPRDVDKEE